ncbi:helix-turn-helix domain-containing protein [Leuconostoc citreum]|uniref:Predicted transcriptional regulator n=1 Tax=Leuconostoc citreum (strain KM20) TaxID=349519 RepID=B1MVM0_LEUCK|nr:helix-turn-helix transcriptional regulator [Leuconostoc citreum]ACA83274.1 Predicted transcriptional regulator [Leuconostoc citreum KM20]MCP1276796.1 helix-turn-helix domain-containing protein [Leuconostoc citreum]MCS8583602.1 XRE family transcriptional regulator [Leuconostoc citreum]MCS8600938.1 XRE family transcriptional regulator [Leuconostoc citreum]MDV8931547.1 helix-turn-helix domain-containing protein [Leuconostoc citreum]
MISKEIFGLEIKRIRVQKHFTVRQTALQGHISPAYLSQIENGNKNIPKVETLYKIAKGLRISENEILDIAGITTHENDKTDRYTIDLGEQLDNDKLLLSFEGKELSPEYRQAILSILKTLPDAKKD